MRSLQKVFTILAVVSSFKASAQECRRIEIPQPLLDAKIIILGELHGTNESPAFAGDLVCNLMQANKKVALALELPLSVQNIADLAIQETNKEEASKLFDQLPFWDSKVQDGRQSQAVKRLMNVIWELRQKEKSVKLFFIDADRPLSQSEREKTMAAGIKAISAELPGYSVVSLIGNVHARKQIGTPWNREFIPMAHFLAGPDIVSLNVKYSSGTAWNCDATGCGVHAVSKVAPTGKMLTPVIKLSIADPNYDGEYDLGEVTGSLPLR